MDRDQLKGWLDAGLSLPQIGALTDRDPSTVGYWVQKHGLAANGRDKYAPRGGLTREQLEPLVEAGKTLAEIAAAVDRSPSTVRHWLSKHGLKTNGRRGPRPRLHRREIQAALANGCRSLMTVCQRHGETEFAIVGSAPRLQCRLCRSEAVARRRRKVKEILVAEAGGRCKLCGYYRCLNALGFHHLDPSKKSFGVSHRGITRAIATVRTEVEKCVLLCANCHAEVEAGAASLPGHIARPAI